MRIGELEVQAVSDGVARVPPSQAYAAFGATGKGTNEADWAAHADLLDADGRLELAMGGFLIRHDDRVLLIDTGMGAASEMGGFGSFGRLLDSLAGLGVRPGDVTDVVLTHLHFDHIGWVSRDDAPVFPHATYRCDVRDWEHFVGSDEGATAVMRPVEHRMELFDGDTTLAPGIDTRLAPGHTPGSTIVVLSSGTARGMLLGDVIHCAVELVDDEWDGISDVDPDLARRTRNALAAELEGADVPVAAAHFPGLAWGRLLPGQGGRSWVFG